ncbi:hypothetical protein C5167_049918 [Papaver somniferum]|uniref:beta-aspartyl-peptidase n=1 Tax=Papaver somniferum TaxID=3469 RepID=A0A4Y7KM64_PAPSO|nr:hypothetical protein C5167_049918 [Papaver somniferum]
MAFRDLIILSLYLSFSMVFGSETQNSGGFPLVISTWPFLDAVRAAWMAVDSGLSAVDSVMEGCSTCEVLRCDGTVGPGGSPDENGETTLDAMIMDGTTMEVGAVGSMRYVKDGIKAAKLVMQHTKHTFLVGDQASAFAISMGLPGPTDLKSTQKWIKWKEEEHCQPNFRKDVMPVKTCGPYHLKNLLLNSNLAGTCLGGPRLSSSSHIGLHNHDTISMAVIDEKGSSRFCSLLSVLCVDRTYSGWYVYLNGATFKIPGRVGDGPIAGSSAYADSDIGACGATGDGDIMMRFLPCQVVESMRLGMEPRVAAKDAISRITRKFPEFVGAIFAVNKSGVHAGACHGWTFQYSVKNPAMKDVEVFTVLP